MAVWSDMNGFPEGGFPVLANDNDMITLGQFYVSPLKANQYLIDVLGNVRLGAVIITQAGAVSGVTTLAVGGAVSGVTTLAANNTVTLSSDTAPLTLSGQNAVLRMSGLNSAIGSALERINKAYIKTLYLDNRPIVGEDLVALISDVQTVVTALTTHTTTHAPSDADNTQGIINGSGALNSGDVGDNTVFLMGSGEENLTLTRLAYSDLKAIMRTYFDTLYTPL